jgi:hypothetical protein
MVNCLVETKRQLEVYKQQFLEPGEIAEWSSCTDEVPPIKTTSFIAALPVYINFAFGFYQNLTLHGSLAANLQFAGYFVLFVAFHFWLLKNYKHYVFITDRRVIVITKLASRPAGMRSIVFNQIKSVGTMLLCDEVYLKGKDKTTLRFPAPDAPHMVQSLKRKAEI